MDLLTIFLCLALFAERKPGEEMENFFSYELTPYPNFFYEAEELSFRKCHNFQRS